MWVAGRQVASSALLMLVLYLAGPHHFSHSAEAGGPPVALISEFYPCGVCDDEYLVIANAGEESIDLMGWLVSDGEGSIAFTASVEVPPRCEVAISMNSSSYEAAYGRRPEVALDVAHGNALVSGPFRLADVGDDIRLVSPDGLVQDAVRYGASSVEVEGWCGPPVPAIRAGEVARRVRLAGTCTDTDSASDWTGFREFRYGYTTFESTGAWVEAGGVSAFCSPDNSLGTVLGRVAVASESVRVCCYEVSSVPVVRALCEAESRGVDVRMLVDGSPVGGIDALECVCLSVLSLAGAEVKCVRGSLSDGVVRHFGVMHAKYLVVDSAAAVVLSENLVESGVPQDTVFGNRGWGAVVESIEISTALARMFDDDSRVSRPDVFEWADDERFVDSAVLPEAPESIQGQGSPDLFRTSSAAYVSIFASPDSSEREPFLCPMLRRSSECLVEQFQVDLDWSDRWYGSGAWSPLLECMMDSLRSGGAARMLMDPSWFNLERNEQVVTYMTAVCTSEGLAGEFALADPRSPITLTHNKGLVLDGSQTIVSSNNWVNASFSRNRELALSVTSEELASYFSGVFDRDWYPDTCSPVALVEGPSEVTSGQLVTLTAAGSTDDRAIVAYEWDLDSDGWVDCTGPTCRFVSSIPGVRAVELSVIDSWGNVGVVVFEVTTRAEWSPPEGSGTDGGEPMVWSAAACVLGVSSLLIMMHRRRG
jgi:cardiolipin synthase